MKGNVLRILLLVLSASALFSQNKSLDARYIASNHYRGVVKILLYDSLAAAQNPERGYIGRGSGFLVNEEGIIFTNRHVVEMCMTGYVQYDYFNEQTRGTDTYTEVWSPEVLQDSLVIKIHRIGYPVPIVQVYTGKGEEDYQLYYARIVSVSMGSFDGAVLKIVSDLKGNPPSGNFFPLPLGNSDSTFQGEDLCVYGYPAQYEGGFDLMLKDMSTLTFGKHSGFDYVLNKDFGYIKTDAVINSGNSGGPVFNQENKVIGIATATATKTNIGLVGGINAMYYLVASDPGLLQQLSAKGLKMPMQAAAMKTGNGAPVPSLSAQQMEAHNRRQGNLHEARMERYRKMEEQGKINPYYMRPNLTQVSFGASAGAATVKRGDLDIFWQNINDDPSLKATGEGLPLRWSACMNLIFKDKKAKGFGGIGYEYARTMNKAIAASNDFSGTTQHIELYSSSIVFRLIAGHRLNNRIFWVIDPALLMGSMKGKFRIYGSEYKIKSSSASLGWQASGGINYMLGSRFGVSFRLGYNFHKIQELHTDTRDGYSSDYMYFFLNETDGDPVRVNWSGFQVMAGIFFSSADLGFTKKKKS